MAIKPKRLKKGSVIGITAPGSPCYDDSIIEKGIETIRTMGFKTVVGSTVYKRLGYLAGEDAERAEEINVFFENREIDGIICLRGGYGASRILDKIDYNIIRHNPKVFVGYSDITAIHLAINRMCNMVTFHGPMITSDFSRAIDDYTINSFFRSLCCTRLYDEPREPYISDKLKVLTGGKARGRIIGGNLTVMVSTIGSRYEIDTRNRILIIEEIGEEPYRIDRMLTQLIMCGKLQKCSGIVLGQFTGCAPEDPERSLSLMDVLKDRLIPLGIPVLYGGIFGHEELKMTLPIGVRGEITEDGRFIIWEEGVV